MIRPAILELLICDGQSELELCVIRYLNELEFVRDKFYWMENLKWTECKDFEDFKVG